MLKRAYALGLLSLTSVGMIALPALADTAVIQRNTQDLYIEGQRNTAVQDSQQININRRTNVRHQEGNVGVVQDTYQGATVVGKDNAAYQGSTQINVNDERRGLDGKKPRPGRGHGRGGISIEQR
ncbi:hypothetical protein OOK60_17775 [Trichothermofontia sichuanensis B231]|uniref:hypothetical protein n=1 Tax=Trichothermofontia sichuanensis TaxID=3045816 RepID=UPI0022480CD2|nr:hypothetical protein [Trichothermofontia sichuanensis]UZQ54302.1 hypothetical protein OOK60_17775 [Trichothermofontia sichuanensis B231]